MEEPTKEPGQKTRIVFKRNQAPNDNNEKPENNNPLDRNKKPTGPKFSFYWIYGILAVVFLFFSYFSNNAAKTIDTKKLKHMLNQGDVSRVVVVNRSKAEIYLTDSAKSKIEYKKDLGEGSVFADTKAANYVLDDIGDQVLAEIMAGGVIGHVAREQPVERTQRR